MGILNFLRGGGSSSKSLSGQSNDGKKNMGNDQNWSRASSPLDSQSKSKSLYSAYEQNVWVYAAVNAIATNTSQAPLKVANKKTDETLENPELNEWGKLFITPNPLIDFTQLMSVTTINYEVCGQAFWILKGADGKPITSVNDIPTEIWPIDPALIKPRYRSDNKPDSGLLGWWLMKPNTNSKEPLEFFQAIRFYKASLRTYY